MVSMKISLIDIDSINESDLENMLRSLSLPMKLDLADYDRLSSSSMMLIRPIGYSKLTRVYFATCMLVVYISIMWSLMLLMTRKSSKVILPLNKHSPSLSEPIGVSPKLP